MAFYIAFLNSRQGPGIIECIMVLSSHKGLRIDNGGLECMGTWLCIFSDILATHHGTSYIIFGKGVQNICIKKYTNRKFFPSFFLTWIAHLLFKIDY